MPHGTRLYSIAASRCAGIVRAFCTLPMGNHSITQSRQHAAGPRLEIRIRSSAAAGASSADSTAALLGIEHVEHAQQTASPLGFAVPEVQRD